MAAYLVRVSGLSAMTLRLVRATRDEKDSREPKSMDLALTVQAMSFRNATSSARTEAVIEQNGKRLRVMKGAVRTIAEACGLQAHRPATRRLTCWRAPMVSPKSIRRTNMSL